MTDFCFAWPDELKEMHRVYCRALYRMKNLEAYIERVTPYEFDAVMDELEQVKEQVQVLAIRFEQARRKWEWANLSPCMAQSRETAE